MPRARPKTFANVRGGKEPFAPASESELRELDEAERPQTRADCIEGQRPCPFVSCKHHLYLDVNPDTGSMRISFPDLEVDELIETCALDVADNGPETLHQVGRLVNLTRERIRQIEVRGLLALKSYEAELEDPPPALVPLFEYED